MDGQQPIRRGKRLMEGHERQTKALQKYQKFQQQQKVDNEDSVLKKKKKENSNNQYCGGSF